MSRGPWPAGWPVRRRTAGMAIAPAWRLAKDVLLPAALAAAAGSFAVLGTTVVAAWHDNQTIADLASGRDVPVDAGSRPELQAARVHFLLRHDRIEDAQQRVAEIKARGNANARLLADLQYNLANAHLRAAIALIEHNRIDAATAFVGLAKDGYRAALTLDPGQWDTRYNLDVAMRLVRDFSLVDPNPTQSTQEPPKQLWTDLPGTPKGLP